MWDLVLTVMVIYGAIVNSTACEVENCFSVFRSQATNLLSGLPTEEELRILCPGALEAFICAHERMYLCTKRTLSETATFTQYATVSRRSEMLLNVEGIVQDLCFEESSLHKGYVLTVSCTREYFSKPLTKCQEDAKLAYRTYKESMTEVLEENGSAMSGEEICLVNAYQIACISSEIKEQCGDLSQEIFAEIVRRSKVWRLYICSENDLTNLKTEFLDSLELEEKDKNLFSVTFDLL